MSNIANMTLWDPEGNRHRISIYRNERGSGYVVRVDGVFYSTAETYTDAKDEAIDISVSCRWSCLNPCVA